MTYSTAQCDQYCLSWFRCFVVKKSYTQILHGLPLSVLLLLTKRSKLYSELTRSFSSERLAVSFCIRYQSVKLSCFSPIVERFTGTDVCRSWEKMSESNETQMAYSDACHEDIELDFIPSGVFSWSNSVSYPSANPSYSSSGASPDKQAFTLDQTVLDPDGSLHHPMQELWQNRRPSIPLTKLEIEAMERAEKRAYRNRNQHSPEEVFETPCEIEAMEQAKRRAQRNKNQHSPEDVFITPCEIEAMERAEMRRKRNKNQHPHEDVFEAPCDEDGPDLDEDDQEVSPRLRRGVRCPWQPSRGRRRRLGRCHSSDTVLDADWVASLREHAAQTSTKQEETSPRRRMAPAEDRRNGVCAKLDEAAAVRTKARVFLKRL